MRLNREVFMEELRRISVIGQDATDFRSSEEHVFWLSLGKELPNRILSREVELAA
jgi:hypothetical protein